VPLYAARISFFQKQAFQVGRAKRLNPVVLQAINANQQHFGFGRGADQSLRRSSQGLGSRLGQRDKPVFGTASKEQPAGGNKKHKLFHAIRLLN
jgi:hypothetical protein